MSELKRNHAGIMKKLVEQNDDSVFCKEACSIIIPSRWLGTRLANTDDGNYVLAYFMIKIGKEYMLLAASGIIEIGAATIQTITVDGVECVEFLYELGEVVIVNLNVAVDNTIPYYMTNIITKKGSQIPYADVNDFQKLLDSVSIFCNLSLPAYCFTNIYMSYIQRDPKDLTIPARLSKNPLYKSIGLNDLQFAVQNTMARFSGPHLDVGIQSSLMYRTEQASENEKILRS